MRPKKGVLGGHMIVLLLLASCCPPDVDSEAFLMEYLQSAYEGSDFHRHHSNADSTYVVAESRSRMTPYYRITNIEVYGWSGEVAYGLEFSNGNRGTLLVSKRIFSEPNAALSVSENGSP
jgi:hypothetical protein